MPQVRKVESVHWNSQNEKLSITKVVDGRWKGRYVLVIYDDPPPLAMGTPAPMLLDEGTRQFLIQELERIGVQH